MADVKGDLAGLSQAGANNPKIVEGAKELKIENFTGEACPVVFWDVFGEQGHPVRATVSEWAHCFSAGFSVLTASRQGGSKTVLKFATQNGFFSPDLKIFAACCSQLLSTE